VGMRGLHGGAATLGRGTGAARRGHRRRRGRGRGRTRWRGERASMAGVGPARCICKGGTDLMYGRSLSGNNAGSPSLASDTVLGIAGSMVPPARCGRVGGGRGAGRYGDGCHRQHRVARRSGVPEPERRACRCGQAAAGAPPARGSPASRARAASWVKTIPRSRNIVARCRVRGTALHRTYDARVRT